jgi:hypothetical protein
LFDVDFQILEEERDRGLFQACRNHKEKMRSVKYKINHLQYKGVYKVECSCKKCYIGEIKIFFQVRIKEHGDDISRERIGASTLAEHSNDTKHHMCLKDTKILAKENHYFKRRIREAIEIIKHGNNLNRDGGLEINENWLPLIHNKSNK